MVGIKYRNNLIQSNSTLFSNRITTRTNIQTIFGLTARRGVKLSKEQAIKAAQEGIKTIYRYVWEIQEIKEEPLAKKLLITTKARIIKLNDPEFYEEIDKDELSTYADIGSLYKKFRLESGKPLADKTWKAVIGEFKINLLDSLRETPNTFLKQVQVGLGKSDLQEKTLKDIQSIASPHAAGQGKEPDVKVTTFKYSQSSQNESELFELNYEKQAKNLTGTKNAEYVGEKSAEKAASLKNNLQQDDWIVTREDDYVTYKFNTKTLTTFMIGKPKINRGADGYSIDEKIYYDSADQKSLACLKEEESVSYMESNT